VFLGTIGTFDPYEGTNVLIFAFEAVVIGGLGSLWGTLVGGMALGVTQEVVGAWYLVIVGGLAVTATLVASRGLWSLVSERYGWSLLPVGYRVRVRSKGGNQPSGA
jgi:branched-subunit amino acid ABC-type transport system permease component